MLVSVLLWTLLPFYAHATSCPESSQWSGWGGDTRNDRWASSNTALSSHSILSAAPHCNASFPIGVSATPVIHNDTVYFPTWDGAFVALNFHTCRVRWSINVTRIIEDFEPISAFQAKNSRAASRTSPQNHGNVVFFGTLTHALIVAVDKDDGKKLGVVQSATVLSDYECYSFVGEMVALAFDAGKFRVLWRVSSIPAARREEGWAGAAFWNSQPSIDAARRQVFVGTGNSYLSSNASVECQRNVTYSSGAQDTSRNESCLPSDVWQDSVLAITIDSGHVNWVQQWPDLVITAASGNPSFRMQNTDLCLGMAGLNSDFGMAPVYVPGHGGGVDKLIAGRKNGNLYSMSAEDGKILWTTATGPKGLNGGLAWGIAVDDARVYFTAINSDYQTWQLQPSKQATNRSAYGAVAMADGRIFCETPVPMQGVSLGPPTVVGDLVLVARTGQDPNGTSSYDRSQGGMIALKGNGSLINDFVLTTNFHGGIAVDGPYIMFDTGYSGTALSGIGSPALVPGGFRVLQVST